MDSRLIFFFTSALIAAAAVAASLSGSTAQCKIKWLFGIDCGDVSGKLVNQIQAWQVKESCVETGEKCSYEGEASSEGSRDQADNSTNFCSLQNLMNGQKHASLECNRSHVCLCSRLLRDQVKNVGFLFCFRK
ncbi:uncharacterized protein wu:fc46h12 isoform X3 [Fundulus heteroclitus]|uniref:uncharacterized protein wu:fc46h12 isoform X3 n=1 Tax=Fundulus heteroclitus TaxID=8078 RepID=UPI00165B2342|nr:uncharacterized protein wu:fc46h12 isoform X3 [Fundulus heteroclitus]